MTKDELLAKYKALNVAEKLVAINLIVFVILLLVTNVFKTSFLFNWFALSTGLNGVLLNPWSVITYSFLHQDPFHLLMNMVVIYYVSKLFFTRFSAKLFLNTYLLGGITGALVYVILLLMLPMFFGGGMPIIGASASVMAVLIFICTSLPQMEVSIFTFKIKIWQLGAFFVVLDAIQVFSGYSAGSVTHLGGALLGYLYATQLKKGIDIGSGFERVMNTIVSWFSFKKKSSLKTVHKTRSEKRASGKTIHQKKRIQQEQIDAILDQISKSGYESLSKEEKAFLFQSGKD
jgi:membrane associated rhomboid family serine protease